MSDDVDTLRQKLQDARADKAAAVREAVEREREECACIVENAANHLYGTGSTPLMQWQHTAEAIRARKSND